MPRSARFLPCYLFTVIPCTPTSRSTATVPTSKAFVDGITAAAIGAITGSVLVIAKRSIVDIPTAILALATVVLLWRFKKLQEPVIVTAAALIGLVALSLIQIRTPFDCACVQLVRKVIRGNTLDRSAQHHRCGCLRLLDRASTARAALIDKGNGKPVMRLQLKSTLLCHRQHERRAMDRANQAGISRPPAFSRSTESIQHLFAFRVADLSALSFSSAALGKALRAIEILAGLSFVAGLGCQIGRLSNCGHFRRASARQFCELVPCYETHERRDRTSRRLGLWRDVFRRCAASRRIPGCGQRDGRSTTGFPGNSRNPASPLRALKRTQSRLT
ncbi:hypothetical protein LA345_39580 (plasmid) [Burkholderia vietnamiensis]|nr:hypothetical protein [Burkholderia vietnamiensis]